MARKNEAEELLKSGKSPSEIAHHMGISVATVRQYLFTRVGEGGIRRSDIVFSIPDEKRHAIEDVIGQKNKSSPVTVAIALERKGFDIDRTELEMYLNLRDSRVSLGDMYEYIREIEIVLHDMVKETLEAEYEGEEWWYKGIPESIRSQCASRKEKDGLQSDDKYCYTTLIDLRNIIDEKWKIFSKVLPSKVTVNKKTLLMDLKRINDIRNRVMHPVKTREFTEEDFCFVRDFNKKIERNKWRFPSTGKSS